MSLFIEHSCERQAQATAGGAWAGCLRWQQHQISWGLINFLENGRCLREGRDGKNRFLRHYLLLDEKMDIGSTVEAWSVNPYVKDWFISPVLGAVAGALFNAFVNSKDEGNGQRIGGALPPPRTVSETRVVYVKTRERAESDGKSEMAIALLFLASIVYAYAAHAPRLIDGGINVAYSSFTLSCFFIIFALWRGRVLGLQWVFVFLYSAVLAAVSAYLLFQAQSGLVPWFPAEIANKGLVGFFLNSLSEYGRRYAITQALGLLCVATVLLWSVGWAIHYIALINNYATGGNRFWSFMVGASRLFGGWRGVLVSLGTFFVDGTFLELWLQQGSIPRS